MEVAFHPRMAQLPEHRVSRRAVEVMVAVIVASIVCLLAGPYLYRLYRRERLRVAAQEMATVIRAVRLKAIQQGRQAVLWIDPASRATVGWAEEPPYNFIQDPGEPTLVRFRMRSGVFFRYSPDGDGVNGADAVAFDTYVGNPKLVDRIVLRPDGSLVPPESPGSKAPLRPAVNTARVPYGSINCAADTSCRGIYLSDRADGGPEARRNTFRVSINDFGPTGRVTILKWMPSSEGGNRGETDYVPPPWKWVD
jgi:type II secretory pathway pseudopilin PulG